MRNVLIRIAVCVITAIIHFSLSASDRRWEEATGGLPYYRYAGSSESDASFLVGNSRVKVITHLNGIYELISADRCWARFNADPVRPDYGKNRATVYIGRKRYELVGPGSLASKAEVYSGAGFARYDYDLNNGVKCSRMISVMPSMNPREATPLFLVTLSFENTGSSARTISYEEAVSPHYVQVSHQYLPEAERPVHYDLSTKISFRCITASFDPLPQGFASCLSPEQRSRNEYAPHSIFIYSDNAFLVVNEGELKASIDDIRLRPGRKHVFHIVVGFAGNNNKEMAEKAIRQAEDSRFGAFSSMWKKHLPDFSRERNKELRNELYYSAYSIESSLVYSDYFKESFIPGKLNDAIKYGENTTNSDHINAALQACYTNPALAKSIIRYVMKQTAFDGMLPDMNKGYGYIPSDSYSENLVQLEVLNVLSEYLRLTGDYEFLDEWMEVYPVERGELYSVKSIVERYLDYIAARPYVTSTMSAMCAAILPKFVEQMEKSGKMTSGFMNALKAYADKSVAGFSSRKEYMRSDLQYLLEAQCLTNARRREIFDDASEKGAVDIRAIPGLSSFDPIDASSLFRTLILQNAGSDGADVMNSWKIYSYFRLKE